MNRLLLLLAALMALISFSTFSRATDFQQKWVYAKSDFGNDAGTDKFIALLKKCQASGVTFVTLSDGVPNHAENAPAGYADNVKRVQDEARADGITLVPMFCSIGYGGAYLGHDANLAAGVPAKNVAYVVTDGVGSPDPEIVPKLVNANFDDVTDGKPVGWTQEATEANCVSSDATVRHGDSGASLKITDFDKLPEKVNDVHVFQVIKNVKSFQYYRVSFWAKTERAGAPDRDPFANAEDFVRITSSGDKRKNTYKNIRINANSDWTRYEITFNTFEVPDGELKFAIGAGDDDGVHSGTIWFDDIKIEPAGMLLILRRPNKPLVVTSEDGATTYTEGKDFEPVADPVVEAKPFRSFRTDHPAPKLLLTKDSAIKNGQRLLVSFFHAMVVYGDQEVVSIQDPKTIELMQTTIANTVKAWPTGHYFLVDDEIRVGGWEVQPEGEKQSPGQILAKATRACYDEMKKGSADAKVYVWSDMFNPFHNARSFAEKGNYYLTNGTYEGSVDGLPKDVVIMNWYAPDNKGPKFFEKLGYKQVLAGYYDPKNENDMKSNITNWMKATDGVEGINGMMYTTWRNNYKDMPRFFELVKAYPDFGDVKVEAPKDR